jgi:glycosyltransferase involved in cell wall biosynthesis
VSEPSRSEQPFALFVPSLHAGGAERMMVVLANGIAARGHRVDLVLVRGEGHFRSRVSAAVRLVDLNARRTLGALPALAGYLRRERPQALLATLSNANVIALLAHRLALGLGSGRARIVVREACTLSTIEGEAALKRFVAPLMRLTYPWADARIVISDGVGDDLAACLGLRRDSMRTIYNPVIDDGLAARAAAPAGHPWLQPGEPPVVLAVGRLAIQKDFPTLIRAFAEVRRQRAVRLLILGDGPDREPLQALVESLGLSSDVAMPGFIDNPYPYMRGASLFVMSSRWEGFGNVLVEAMACGTPVVSTDCPSGPREILENGRWGALVPVGDANALAGAMTTQLESGAAPHMAESVMMRFHEDRIVDEYLRVLIGDARADA